MNHSCMMQLHAVGQGVQVVATTQSLEAIVGVRHGDAAALEMLRCLRQSDPQVQQAVIVFVCCNQC